MPINPSAPPAQTWQIPNQSRYFVSTDTSLLDLEAVAKAFNSDEVYWTGGWEAGDELRRCLEGSMCFGVFWIDDEGTTQTVGLARLITDYSTTAYLTDVYTLPAHKRLGLMTFVIKLIDEILSSWPKCRRLMMITGQEMLNGFYKKHIEGMDKVEALVAGKRYQGGVDLAGKAN